MRSPLPGNSKRRGRTRRSSVARPADRFPARADSMRITAILILSLTAFAATPSPVADAAMKGDTQTVRRRLTQKTDVTAPQPDGAAAIQWAAFSNNLELADLLIAAGANVRAANR